MGSPVAFWNMAAPLVVILVEGSTSLGSSQVFTYTRELVVVTTFQKASVILTVARNPTPAACVPGEEEVRPMALPGSGDSPPARTCTRTGKPGFTVKVEEWMLPKLGEPPSR